MTESPWRFHCNAIEHRLREAIRKGEISELDAEIVTLYLAEKFRRARDFDPYEPLPRAILWPWVAAGAAALAALPALIVWGMR